MDALKFAFNTLVIGALALPWLAVLMRMYFLQAEDRKADGHLALVSLLPEHARDAVLSVVILALGYFLGAAISRVSDDFFGDNDLWSFPTEPSIRKDVYFHEYCEGHSVTEAQTLPAQYANLKATFCRSDLEKLAAWQAVSTDVLMQFFRLEEGKLLLQGDEKTTRLRELHDQIVILRGATLNGMLLSTLCLFGYFISFESGPRTWRSLLTTRSAAVALTAYGVCRFALHLYELRHDPDSYRDPPLAEGVMILVGIAGALGKATAESRRKFIHGCGLAFLSG